MKLKYVNQIRSNLTISSNKKTNNLLDGTYKSVYKGKSMNFENLREYTINDDVKDIDWKASSRSGNLLVKQFIAEKKHNILLVMDTGAKMNADTKDLEEKKEVALFSAGTIGYLAIKNGDYVGMIYNHQEEIHYKPFQYDYYHLEQYLTEYEKEASRENKTGLNKAIHYLCRNIKKRMIVFIITDLKGLAELENSRIQEISTLHDLLVIVLSDASIQTKNAYDVEKNNYIPSFFAGDEKLKNVEQMVKKDLLEKNQKRIQKYGGNLIFIDNIKEIPLKVIELLERHSYASNR